MLLIFKYNDKLLKFFPTDNNIGLIDYANNNLPNNTPYKVLESIEGLTEADLRNILNDPDGLSISNNSLF